MSEKVIKALVIVSHLINVLASNMTALQQVWQERSSKDNNCVLFQDIRYRSRSRRSASYQPPCAHGDNWCEEVMDYPESYIKQVSVMIIRCHPGNVCQVLNSSHALWSLMRENARPKPRHRPRYRHSHRQPRLLQVIML